MVRDRLESHSPLHAKAFQVRGDLNIGCVASRLGRLGVDNPTEPGIRTPLDGRKAKSKQKSPPGSPSRAFPCGRCYLRYEDWR